MCVFLNTYTERSGQQWHCSSLHHAGLWRHTPASDPTSWAGEWTCCFARHCTSSFPCRLVMSLPDAPAPGYPKPRSVSHRWGTKWAEAGLVDSSPPIGNWSYEWCFLVQWPQSGDVHQSWGQGQELAHGLYILTNDNKYIDEAKIHSGPRWWSKWPMFQNSFHLNQVFFQTFSATGLNEMSSTLNLNNSTLLFAYRFIF